MEAPPVMFIVVMMLLKTCYSEEPECSRFQYEEKLLEKLIRMEIGMHDIRQEMKRMDERVNQGLSLLQSERQVFKEDIDKMKTGFGTVYVRWGRNTCPEGAALVYKGYIAGKGYNLDGSGSDSVCLPSNPTWSKYVDGNNDCCRAYIYGTEIDIQEPSNIFDYEVNEQDIPCAVCKANTTSTVMIPARSECYPRWSLEYAGYLMAGVNGHKGNHNHICMDVQPEFVPNGSANNNQHILYFVEAQCGSLPCPPYVQGRELACVVCSQ